MGQTDAIITSPPYADQVIRARTSVRPISFDKNAYCWGTIAGGAHAFDAYGTADGQVGVVVKDFVRAKKRVPLCDQTWRLLLSLGFTPVERIRCLLSEETREPSLFGGCEVKKRSRVSFFRRLAEKKGAPPIDAEEILVVRRPPASVPCG